MRPHDVHVAWLRPDFMERMEFKYSEQAREAGCYIVSAAGFDSIPADVGTLWNAAKFAALGGLPSSVESFLTFRSAGSVKGASNCCVIICDEMMSP